MHTRLLVPIDFSEASADAYRFAQHLALFYGSAQLSLVHAVSADTVADFSLSSPAADYRAEQQASLERFAEAHRATPYLRMDASILDGHPLAAISAHSEHFDLIVMGTTGESLHLERWFGSISTELPRRAHCPVLLVPSGCQFHRPQRFLYAADHRTFDTALADELYRFNEPFAADVHFVHVNDGSHKAAIQKVKAVVVDYFIAKDKLNFSFEVHEIPGDATADALLDYARQHSADWLLLAARQQRWWQRLFSLPASRPVALQSDRPVLIFQAT